MLWYLAIILGLKLIPKSIMIITSILEELESATNPVAKPLHKSENGKAICIGFKKGMLLKEHKAHLPTTLVVLKGNIVFAI